MTVIGDVLVAQGNLPEALKSFREGLAIAERLAAADKGNAGWQRDLSVSFNKIGDVLVAQGNLPEALKSFVSCDRERLAAADKGNAGWQFDLGISHERIGDVCSWRRAILPLLSSLSPQEGDHRASSGGGQGQCGLAARPVGFV
ncbi:MAG: tetratricopeptide repeat protein [Hyphomicrobiaceae bacterium]